MKESSHDIIWNIIYETCNGSEGDNNLSDFSGLKDQLSSWVFAVHTKGYNFIIRLYTKVFSLFIIRLYTNVFLYLL